jgi:hypothetical protein
MGPLEFGLQGFSFVHGGCGPSSSATGRKTPHAEKCAINSCDVGISEVNLVPSVSSPPRRKVGRDSSREVGYWEIGWFPITVENGVTVDYDPAALRCIGAAFRKARVCGFAGARQHGRAGKGGPREQGDQAQTPQCESRGPVCRYSADVSHAEPRIAQTRHDQLHQLR